MRRGQVLRLIWIDAYIEAGKYLLQREHIMLAFDISVAQATLDLRAFLNLFPARIVYDKRKKGYMAGTATAPFTASEHSAALLAGAAAATALNRLTPLLSQAMAAP